MVEIEAVLVARTPKSLAGAYFELGERRAARNQAAEAAAAFLAARCVHEAFEPETSIYVSALYLETGTCGQSTWWS